MNRTALYEVISRELKVSSMMFISPKKKEKKKRKDSSSLYLAHTIFSIEEGLLMCVWGWGWGDYVLFGKKIEPDFLISEIYNRL